MYCAGEPSGVEGGFHRMLSSERRMQLRQQSVNAWENAKRLAAVAQSLQGVSSELVSEAARHRVESYHTRMSATRRVDCLIDERLQLQTNFASASGVGLVVADDLERIGFLHDVLHEHVGTVFAANDGPAAVGLAIVEQPDIVVLDEELPVMSSFDTAVALRAYSPATAIVLVGSGHSAEDATLNALFRQREIPLEGFTGEPGVADRVTSLDELAFTIGRIVA